MEQLQFSTRPFYTVSAPVDFDFASLSQSKSRLTKNVIVGRAIRVHITEIVVIVVIGGAEPPVNLQESVNT